MFAAAASLVPDSPDPPRNCASSKCFRRACSDSFVRCALLGKSALDATDVTLCCQELSCLHASARLFKSMLGIGIRTLAPYAPDKLTCARSRRRMTVTFRRARSSVSRVSSSIAPITDGHRHHRKSQSQRRRDLDLLCFFSLVTPTGTSADFERTVSRV